MKNIKQVVKNIEQFLADAQRQAMLHSSDAFVQQMPLKPGIFHERDDIIDEITQLLMKEETSCICIFGPGGIMPLGWVRLQFTERRRTATHQSPISTRKPCLGALH